MSEVNGGVPAVLDNKAFVWELGPDLFQKALPVVDIGGRKRDTGRVLDIQIGLGDQCS